MRELSMPNPGVDFAWKVRLNNDEVAVELWELQPDPMKGYLRAVRVARRAFDVAHISDLSYTTVVQAEAILQERDLASRLGKALSMPVEFGE